MRKTGARKINPFRIGQQVRFKHCSDPACACRSLLPAPGSLATVGKCVGKTVCVQFKETYGGFMKWETGFRVATITDHLEPAELSQT